MAKKTKLALFSFVLRGKNRRNILNCFDAGKVLRQADIHVKTKIHRTHVRRCLMELENQGLISCLTPKEIQGKLYKATILGKSIIAKMKKFT